MLSFAFQNNQPKELIIWQLQQKSNYLILENILIIILNVLKTLFIFGG